MNPSARRILRHVPNALTLLRLGLVAVFPASPERWRTAVLCVALATEYLDGALSRRLDAQTRFGRLLDPVADKLFFASVALTFVAEDRLGVGELVLLALRDVGVLVALVWLVARQDWKRLAGIAPGSAGKATTVLQYAAFLALLFWGAIHPVLVALTAVTGALAVVQYFQRVVRPAITGAPSAS